MQEVVHAVCVDAHGAALRRLVDLVGSAAVASNGDFDVVLRTASAPVFVLPATLRT